MKGSLIGCALTLIITLTLSDWLTKWVTTAGNEFVVISAESYTAGGRPGNYDNRCIIVARRTDTPMGRYVFDVQVKDGVMTGHRFRTSFGKPIQPATDGKRHHLRIGSGTIKLGPPGNGCI